MDPQRSASRMTGGHDSVKNNWILRANALWMTTMSTHFFALLRVTETRIQDDSRLYISIKIPACKYQ